MFLTRVLFLVVSYCFFFYWPIILQQDLLDHFTYISHPIILSCFDSSSLSLTVKFSCFLAQPHGYCSYPVTVQPWMHPPMTFRQLFLDHSVLPNYLSRPILDHSSFFPFFYSFTTYKPHSYCFSPIVDCLDPSSPVFEFFRFFFDHMHLIHPCIIFPRTCGTYFLVPYLQENLFCIFLRSFLFYRIYTTRKHVVSDPHSSHKTVTNSLFRTT